MNHHVSRLVKRRGASLAVAVVAALACGAVLAVQAAQAGTLTMVFNAEVNAAPGCGMWTMNDPYGNSLVNFSSWVPNGPCGPGGPMYIANDAGGLGGPSVAGQRVLIETVAPAGIAINSATISGASIVNINNGKGWGGGSFYAGGGSQWSDFNGISIAPTDRGFSSSYWGFQMVCGWSKCTNSGSIDPGVVTLTATENQGPGLVALGSNNLWYQGAHYVWNPPGDPWPIPLQASDPSGVCAMGAVVDGGSIGGPSATPNNTVWHQCPDQTWQGAGASVDTRSFVPGAGALSFEFYAFNAASAPSAVSETLHVDNDSVQLSLSGPTTASTAAGTQSVTASASAGPSGVAIGCSVDGGPVQWILGATDSVPVAGAGEHVVSCRAHNGAIDPQGQYAYSATKSWSVNIGQPTLSAISFTKLVDALKCHRERRRVTVPAHWVTVRRHHKRIKVRKPAHTKTVNVQRCHPRIVWKRETVWVKVHRHGRTVSVKRIKRVRVVLTPHTVTKTKERVAYGHGATVSGWLGTASSAIAGAPVDILTAPNNGLGQFSLAATTITAANGSWSVNLPPGPSRLVEAVYAGAAGLLPAQSAPVELDVPAHIIVAIRPRSVPWSGVVTITGHLSGGFVPPDGVALRLLVRYPGTPRPSVLLALRTDARGRFRIKWSYHAGRGVATYPMTVATTATETDYAFAAARSPWLRVTFGRR